MGTKYGGIGRSGNELYFLGPQYIGITMSGAEYPKGTLEIDVGYANQGKAYWRNNGTRAYDLYLWLCDSGGGNECYLGMVTINANSSYVGFNSWYVDAPQLRGKALYITGGGVPDQICLKNYAAVECGYDLYDFSISVGAGTGGSLSASHSRATPGTWVSLYPSAGSDYVFDHYSASGASLSGNGFTMPSNNVSVTAYFRRKQYAITLKSNPANAGLVTSSAATAQSGATITLGQTPAAGYYFTGWSISPSRTIDENNRFTMPAQGVTVTANYLKVSTGELDKTTLTAGDSVVLSITAENVNYSHKYKLSFGEEMETDLTDIEAKKTAVTFTIPMAWCSELTDATEKVGGTLLLETYNGETKIGDSTIIGLTFAVPASVVPTMDDLETAIVRTIGGVTYADIGNYYVQNHCGVRTQTEAEGAYGSSIVSMNLAMTGYEGNKYNKIQSGDEIDFTSDILTIAGDTKITVTATDSRGRTCSKSATITVQKYSSPSGSLEVWRVDSNGDPSDSGSYAQFQCSSQYTQLGTNALTVTLSGSGFTGTINVSSGDVLPGDRKVFSPTQEYEITLTLADALETVSIVRKLPTARFIIHVDPTGKKIAFMKAATKTVPAGKESNIEFPSDAQIWIGDDTLEQYIENIVNNM